MLGNNELKGDVADNNVNLIYVLKVEFYIASSISEIAIEVLYGHGLIRIYNVIN